MTTLKAPLDLCLKDTDGSVPALIRFHPLDHNSQVLIEVRDQQGVLLGSATTDFWDLDNAMVAKGTPIKGDCLEVDFVDYATMAIRVDVLGQKLTFHADHYAIKMWRRAQVGLDSCPREQFNEEQQKSEEWRRRHLGKG